MNMSVRKNIDRFGLVLMILAVLLICSACSKEVKLGSLRSDKIGVVASVPTDVVFTVDVTGEANAVSLHGTDDVVLGHMCDDGLNGDIVAGDGVYTYVLEICEDTASCLEFYAEALNTKSEKNLIYVFTKPAKEDEAQVVCQDIMASLGEIEETYTNGNGYVAADNIPALMSEVAECLRAMQTEGVVLFYETDGQSAYAKLASGISIVYEPCQEGVSAGGSDAELTIITYQPHTDIFNEEINNFADSIARYMEYPDTQKYIGESVSIAAVKALGSNQVILWNGHGGYSSAIGPYLATGEAFDWNAWWWDLGYFMDCVNDRIVYTGTEVQPELAGVTPRFIDYYCSNMTNSLIYLASCHSAQDSRLADEFLKKGAMAVVGFSDTVYTGYALGMMGSTLSYMTQLDEVTNNYTTLKQAQDMAMELLGVDDSVWAKKQPWGNNIKPETARPIIFGGEDANNYRLAEYVSIDVIDFIIPEELVLTLGELSVIEPELQPQNATEYTIKWSSSDESVATVSPNGEAGIITSHAKGTAVITAELTSGGKTITRSTQIRVASKARDTVLVLDVSGSMYGMPMQEMKESAIQFCNDLLKDEYNNRVGLVFYDDDIITVDLTDDLDMLISRINAVTDGGTTNMEAGLATASEMLAYFGRDGAIKNVVVMADGLPNEGKTSTSGSMPDGNYSWYYTSVSYANAVIDTAEAMKDSCHIYSLGFFHDLSGESKDFAVQLMQKLTNETDGYHQVDRAEDLQFAFGDISEDISVGSKIVINIACPVDVRVAYNGETLSSAESTYCDMTSFGTLQLLGKDRDIKVLSLDSDKEYEVALTGTGIGKMDYSVSYFDENEQISDYRSFEAVPITMTTVITSDTNNTGEDVSLNIDNDGDGEVDTVWTAEAKSAGKVTYEKEPSETEPTTEPTTQPEPAPDPEPAYSIDSVVLVSVLAVVAMAIIGGVIVILFSVAGNKKEDPEAFVIDETGAQNEENDKRVRSQQGEKPKEKAFNSDDVVVLWYLCPKCGAQIENPHRWTGGKGEWSCWRCDYRSSDDFKHENQITEETEQRTGSIQIISGTMNGFVAPIRDGETLCLGKDPKFANIVFTGNYEKVSRMHCTITYDAAAKHYYVVDCSSNGTFLAGKVRMEKGKRTLVTPKTVITLANDNCTVLLG